MIKAVVFDLGKVLVEFDYSIAARKISARGKLTPEATREVISQSPLLFRYETGLMTTDQFYAEICAGTGFSGKMDEFASCFSDIFEPIPAMVELHGNLRAAGLPTYIFSNTNELAVAHIRRSYPFFGNFDAHILSYEHQSMKPDLKIYEAVEKVTGRGGAEILYIDDRPENIATGEARGWNVILQETPGKTLAAIRALGLTV